MGPLVTVETLLREMDDLERLTRPAHYRVIEASSYDRASTDPRSENWFANADFGKYIRIEGQERVLLDAKGPGALVRIWSANPMGEIRLYIDGDENPIRKPMAAFLGGQTSEWPSPYGFVSARGYNFQYPIPFARSLKVTVVATKPEDRLDALYYQLSVRQYEAGTTVQSLARPAKPAAAPRVIEKPRLETETRRLRIGAGETVEFRLKSDSPREIREFTLRSLDTFATGEITSPRSAESALKRVEVCLAFDGQETVRAPLPDFFGAAVAPATLDTVAAKVNGARSFTQFLPMPFARTARLRLKNHNKFEVGFDASLGTRPSRSQYVLHANWNADVNPSRPMRDLTVAKFRGEGRYVGTVLHVQNPTKGWWGEGDEKVWVDGERFPSWFGTGTEDYFGYAWCHPEVFNRPYYAQPRVDGPGNGGQTGNVRWHLMDDIPFRTSIDFKLEMWHWEDVPSRFATTGFWYALPSAWEAPPVDATKLAIIAGPLPPKPIPGAIEGESLLVSKTGGTTELQAFDNLSKGQQLWWRDAREGDSLEIRFDSNRSGKLKLAANLCHATDYGIHEILLNGTSLGTYDFYSPTLKWKVVELGQAQVRSGSNTLKVLQKGSNVQSNPARRMFGLDYLLIKP